MKTALLLLALSTPLLSLGQSRLNASAKKSTSKPVATHRQSSTMQGLGPFKLGVTKVEDIETLASSRNLSLSSVEDYADILTMPDSAIVELKYTPGGMMPYVSSCPETRVILVKLYEVAGIQLTNTYLTFYKGVLRDFRTDYSSELSEAFEAKYGAAELQVKRSKVPCILKLTGRQINYDKKEFTSIWYNGSLSATFYIGDSFDEKCEKSVLSYVSFYDTNFLKPMAACEVANNSKQQAQQKAALRKKLGDL